MFGSFMLGMMAPLVMIFSLGLGALFAAAGAAPLGVIVVLVGIFASLYMRYLSKHTQRIRK